MKTSITNCFERKTIQNTQKMKTIEISDDNDKSMNILSRDDTL